MKIKFAGLLPKDPSAYSGPRFVRIITAIYLAVILVRSCIHLFAPDGGAQSIASIDVSVEGGNNIISIFHQWGASQLLLAMLLLALFFKYSGLTPLILLSLAIEPLLRALAGQIMPITSVNTPPGAALDWPAFFLIAALFVLSLLETRPKDSTK